MSFSFLPYFLTISAVLLCAGIGSLRAQNTDKASVPEVVEAANAPEEELPTNIGVPAECEDVMLQAFYWDSYKTQTGTDSKYGRTKWIDLLKDTAVINKNFDLVWFPPSAKADGTESVVISQETSVGSNVEYLSLYI